MQIEIPSEIVKRLMRLNNVLPFEEQRSWLRSVFIERRNGHAWIGATNAMFAAVQYLGPRPGDDGFLIVRNEGFTLEPEQHSVMDTPELGWCTIDGVSVPDAPIRSGEPMVTLKKWRSWFEFTPATAPGRSMFVGVDGLASLAAASPSGFVVFPQIIDARQPIIVRDRDEPNWIGVFYALPENGLFIDGATMPEWVKQ